TVVDIGVEVGAVALGVRLQGLPERAVVAEEGGADAERDGDDRDHQQDQADRQAEPSAEEPGAGWLLHRDGLEGSGTLLVAARDELSGGRVAADREGDGDGSG